MSARTRLIAVIAVLPVIFVVFFACSNPAGEKIVEVIMVDTPTVSSPGGQIPAGTKITLECATPGAEIWYTLDGTDPQKGVGALYEGSITIGAAVTLKAIAFFDGMEVSEMIEVKYTVTSAGGGGGSRAPGSASTPPPGGIVPVTYTV